MSRFSSAGPVVWVLIVIAVIFGGLTFRRLGARAARSIPGLASPATTFEEELAATRPAGGWTPSGTDGGSYDWEQPTFARDVNQVSPTFSSSRKLPETTAFIAWALNRYGFDPNPGSQEVISKVRFNGCVMQFNSKSYLGDHENVNETDYKLHLGDVHAADGIQCGSSIRMYTDRGKVEKLNHYWVKQGARMVERTDAHTDYDNDVVIPTRRDDNINVRVAYALAHAARLCGAPAK